MQIVCHVMAGQVIALQCAGDTRNAGFDHRRTGVYGIGHTLVSEIEQRRPPGGENTQAEDLQFPTQAIHLGHC